MYKYAGIYYVLWSGNQTWCFSVPWSICIAVCAAISECDASPRLFAIDFVPIEKRMPIDKTKK